MVVGLKLRAVASALPSESWWSRCKRNFGEAVLESPLLQSLCCYDSSEVQSFKADREIRNDIRESMRTHMGYGSSATCVENVIVETFNETGYDLSNLSTIRSKCAGKRKTMAEWDRCFEKMGIDPMMLATVEILPTCVVPKFAASMSLMLRSKLGRLAPNEANTLLVEREYLRVARKLNVRDVDIVAHQQFVLNAVFGEGILDSVALTRSRIPRWMRWAFEVETPKTPVRVC